MPVNTKCKLIKKEILKDDIYKFSCFSKEICNEAKPGQFLEIKVSDNIEPILRRPISIYSINKEESIIEFVFQVKGKGTEILSKRREGDEIDIIGPLGYGTFTIECNKNVALIGGGIGIFPLYELAKQLKKNNKVNTYLGFRNKDYVILENSYNDVSDKLVVTTDDGSYKIKGFAINELIKDMERTNFDKIYACGPLPMLKAVKKLAIEKNIPCEISLEERMGCGIGACLGCAVKTKDGEYKHVCKQGPVFNCIEVEI